MPHIDVERALKALDGNLELLKDLARMFVEDAPVLMENLKTALLDNDPLNARSVVHNLKGLVSTFFAKASVEIAQRLEDSAAIGDLTPFFTGELDRLEDSISLLTSDFTERGWVDQIG